MCLPTKDEVLKRIATFNETGDKACRVCIIYDERMTYHAPPTIHQERPSRICAIIRRLEADGLLDRCAVYASEQAELALVTLVHSSLYVRRIIKGDIRGIKEDMYFGPGSEDAIFLAAGGAVKACDLVASGKHQYGFAIVRPPGHHASSDAESGFCYFNNIAIAARHLLKEYKMRKVLILDWDVHFGDGTSKIFYKDSSVLFVSMHRRSPFFPTPSVSSEKYIGEGEGKGYNCNICWSGLVNDDDFYAALDYLIMPLAQDYNPDIILVSAGFDAAFGDRAGCCYVTDIGYATVLHKLLQLKKQMVLVLEGGYCKDALATCCASCIKVLDGDESMIKDITDYTPLESTWTSIVKLRELLQPFHPSLSTEIPAQVLLRFTKEHNQNGIT